jgi:hypothetical protein
LFSGNSKGEGRREEEKERVERERWGENREREREGENLERIERGKERDWIEIESRERDRGSEKFFSCLRASTFEVADFTFVCLIFFLGVASWGLGKMMR